MPDRKNPIEKRFERLEGFWNEFAENPDARVLRWLADQETVRMVDAFVTLQNDEVAGTVPDLFVEFTVPFSSEADYCQSLADSLIQQFADVRDAIAEDGMNVDWQAPVASVDNHGDLIACFQSFQQCYQAIMPHFVAVLIPEKAPGGPQAWTSWLGSLLETDIPPEIRFMILDDLEDPILDELAEQHPESLLSLDPELDMPGAYQELADEAEGSGPGHDFRKLYVGLTNAAGSGDLEQAKTLGARAVELAALQQWHHLVAVAQMALGAAYFGAGKIDETIQCYQAANKAAVQSDDDTVGPKLDVQTRMAEGSALVSAGRFKEAAEVFANTVPLAKKTADQTAELECARMAGWCFEVDGDADQAWSWGELAVAAGAAMDDENRQTSTLPYTGQMLTRLADNGTHTDQKASIQDQMESLLGANWESALEGAAG